MRRTTLFCCFLALVVMTGCGPKKVAYNSNSGPDGVRDTAVQLHLNTSDDDRCNAEKGDNEDWRYVLVQEPGLLRISVRVDNPKLKGDLFLHDGFGRALERLPVTEGSDFYEFAEKEVEPGRFYFRIACQAGQSVYTVSAAFAEPEPVAVHVVQPEPEPEPEPERRRRRRTRRTRRTRTEAPPPQKDPEPEPEPSAPPKKVVGTITLVTPGETGKAKITIRGIGSKYGVDTSMKGKIKGLGKTVELYDCSSTKCQGVVSADEEQLKSNNKVEFLVPAE